MRIVRNNSGLWCQRKTTQFRLENENSEPQMWDKHGHVVISAVCRKRQPVSFARLCCCYYPGNRPVRSHVKVSEIHVREEPRRWTKDLL